VWFVGQDHLNLFVMAVSAQFMLYGPDTLISATGAIDRIAQCALVAAGIIGMGSCGSVVQEQFVGMLYEEQSRI
jgi:hypothetical protein